MRQQLANMNGPRSLKTTGVWADAQRDGRLANTSGAVCEGSVIPLLVPRRKVWLTPAAEVPWSNAANIKERKTKT